jgi:hypothetical protein
MATTITKKRPIDAFKEYFLEVKPYHAKILEIVEKYNFYDSVNVGFNENIVNNLQLANNILCKPVGFGLEWDEGCGFDATECCTLGTCNIDSTALEGLTATATLPIKRVVASTGDIFVSGNQTYDQTLQIKSILNQTTLSFVGDQTAYFTSQPIFVIIPYNTIKCSISNPTSLDIVGNYASQFSQKRKFEIYGSNNNDGTYDVASAIYTRATNTTTLVLAQPLVTNDSGNILVESVTKNNGVFTVSTSSFDGANTTVVIDGSFRKLILESNPTSVLFKNGFLQHRVVEITGDADNAGQYLIVNSTYNASTGLTDISISNVLKTDRDCTISQSLVLGLLVVATSTPDPTATVAPTPPPTVTPTPTVVCGNISLKTKLSITDYINDLKCGTPKESNVSVNFGEHLVIIGGGLPPQPTPTPTPSQV